MKCNNCKIIEMKVNSHNEGKIIYKCPNCGNIQEEVINVDSSEN